MSTPVTLHFQPTLARGGFLSAFLNHSHALTLIVSIMMIGVTIPADAETSSWSSRVQPASPKARPALRGPITDARRRQDSSPDRRKQQHNISKTPTTNKPVRSRTARPAGPAPADAQNSSAAQLAEQAYFAFDQGRFLKAIDLAKRAADMNDPQAHTLLGRIYREGHGVSQNAIVAAQWFYRGASLGDVEAIFAYGLMAARGEGMQKDLAIAAQYLDSAAAQGHILAKYNRALLYVQLSQKPDALARAFKLMREAAEAGHIPAQYNLGVFYADGLGVTKDEKQAALWIGKAADAGDANAQLDYARLWAKGLGVPKNGKKAFDYIKRAALQNNPVAQNRLARFYAYGVEVEPDIIEATKWHLLARAAGVSDGRLDQYISRNTPKERAEAEKKVRAWQARFAKN